MAGPDPQRTASVPATKSLSKLRAAAVDCTACPLYRKATQTVFGEGPRRASLMLVGEQPGDHEDLEGRPFVGPAGRLLEQALVAADIRRENVYLTNAVKHFKWEFRGKRRLHQKPNAREISACRPWLEAELAAVRPSVLVCLGATATRAVFGTEVRVLRDRGKIRDSRWCIQTLVTVHPSSLLRIPGFEHRARAFADFVRDLRTAVAAV